MIDKPPEPNDERPDADEVFAATVRNLLNTPHQPHAPLNPPKAQRKAKKG
jgi:hypothetical protein